MKVQRRADGHRAPTVASTSFPKTAIVRAREAMGLLMRPGGGRAFRRHAHGTGRPSRLALPRNEHRGIDRGRVESLRRIEGSRAHRQILALSKLAFGNRGALESLPTGAGNRACRFPATNDKVLPAAHGG